MIPDVTGCDKGCLDLMPLNPAHDLGNFAAGRGGQARKVGWPSEPVIEMSIDVEPCQFRDMSIDSSSNCLGWLRLSLPSA